LILGALVALVAPDPNAVGRRVSILLLAVLVVAGSALGVQRWRGFGMRLGSTMYAQQSADRMIAELRKKIKENPQDASAHYALADAYFVRQDFPEGEIELKRVLELQPRNSRARMDLGAAYLSQEQSKEAQEQFRELVTQEPNNADAHVGLGMALAGQDNHETAINEYKTALRLDPRARSVYYRLGISQAQLKQYDEAIASYSKEKEENGDDAELEAALSDAYQAKGMTQEAQEARDKAAQLQSGQRD
jgi:tetratricopeptide (TPR) repeat protein